MFGAVPHFWSNCSRCSSRLQIFDNTITPTRISSATVQPRYRGGSRKARLRLSGQIDGRCPGYLLPSFKKYVPLPTGQQLQHHIWQLFCVACRLHECMCTMNYFHNDYYCRHQKWLPRSQHSTMCQSASRSFAHLYIYGTCKPAQNAERMMMMRKMKSDIVININA